MKRLTEEEFLQRINNANPNIIPLGNFIGVNKRIKVKCKNCEKIWEPIAASVLKGTGCRECYKKVISDQKVFSHAKFIEKFNIINKNGNIKILGTYISSKSRIKCMCVVCNNVWNPVAGSLLKGVGCSVCAGNGKKAHKKFVDEVALSNPSIKIIGEYINAHTSIEVKCLLCGREWNAKPNNILSGQGCRFCSQKKAHMEFKLSQNDFIKRMQGVNPNITILGAYNSYIDHVMVKCNLCNCEWNPIAGDLLRGTGCPICAKSSSSFSEQFILYSLRKVYGEKEVLSRDKKLIGKELDIYIPKRKIAIEPGAWHWHKNKYDSDMEKKRLCIEKDVKLVIIYDSVSAEIDTIDEIDYIFHFDLASERNYSNLKQIVNEIILLIGDNYEYTNEEYEEIANIAYIKSKMITKEDFCEKLLLVNQNIEAIGEYRGALKQIECRCKICGYIWATVPAGLLRGGGCPACASKNRCKSTAEFITELEKVNSYIEVLGEYTKGEEHIEVKCKKCGHKWTPIANNILKRNRKCPNCNRIKRSLSEEDFLRRMAEKSPNITVVGRYTGTSNRIDLRCKICGNEWSPYARSVRNCPKCVRKRTD